MKIQKSLFLVLLLFCFGLKMEAQEKNKIRPYTIGTTYEKLKKDYPFISPLESKVSEEIFSAENVVYKEVDDEILKADIYAPKTENGQNYPAVLLIHGGGWLTGSKENLRPMAQDLAKNGYVAITATYRLGARASYPAAVVDLKDAVKWMRKNAEKYNIDRSKIAILGASAGAQLATLIGVTPNASIYSGDNTEVSDEVQAIVNIDGIVSFIHPDAEEGTMAGIWLGGSEEENREKWKEASPLEYVDQNTPPTLFINSAQPRFHAGRDNMIQILNKNGIYNEVHTIPQSPHSFWLMHPWHETTLNYTVDFLNKIFVKNAEKKQQAYREITVAKDGSGEFSTIQEAVNSTRDLGPGEVIIHIKNGTYNEKLVIPSWKHKLSFVGEDPEKTIISNSDYSGKTDSVTQKTLNTFTSYTVLVQGDDIKIENITIENTWCNRGQAVALHVEGDHFIIKNSRILGCQDTIYAATAGSRQLYLNCYIEGTTDFIFGQATAVFKNCTIKSLQNSYITAAATTPNQEFGFVFFDCELIAEDDVDKVYLGRPWRPSAQTVFINSEMGNHIVSEGWDAWEGDEMFPNKERTTFYAEYNSSGAGASPETRVEWSHQLTSEEVQKYTVNNILGGKDHWRPLQK
ncbi:pectinesterase family protein [Salegentibacter sp. F188]|uniref:Pectinesterase n=1 Tax=Autumnicola patrickiae TaxID=3075591 RepID=A0ABU3DYX2_9FLAO|nr:pectinesterase family protein [Salegentibacter sp. F188]MDT0688907.1 pectinesterase family protein [Salegentibacter sp. F188]